MKCPHCLDSIHETWGRLKLPNGSELMDDIDGQWVIDVAMCPACTRWIMRLRLGNGNLQAIFRPKSPSRVPLSDSVPPHLSEDYREACLVLPDSPKASAALSRRCLQNVLRDYFQITKPTLSQEIDEVIATGGLPSYVADAVDAIRNIGNFSAHPLKDSNTGAIIEVEPGEAEWCLDVLESFFDFCFVQPALLQAKKDALNQKLADAGKPPMK